MLTWGSLITGSLAWVLRRKEGNPLLTSVHRKSFAGLTFSSITVYAMPTVLMPLALLPGGTWVLRPDCSFSSPRELCPERKTHF